MRLLPLATLLLLTLASDLIFRPFWPDRWGAPDLLLLFVAWLASIDRRPRVYLVVLMVGITRSLYSVDSFPLSWAPLLITAECQFFFRRWVHLRAPIRRLPVLGVTIAIASASVGYLLTHSADAALVIACSWAGLYAVVAAAILFPILDFFAPLLRSPRYPM